MRLIFQMILSEIMSLLLVLYSAEKSNQWFPQSLEFNAAEADPRLHKTVCVGLLYICVTCTFVFVCEHGVFLSVTQYHPG